jgi:hypothetical protein
MQRFLIDHALKNVWCNPQQDNQMVIAATRLTRDNGELNRFTLMNRQVSLPLAGKRYHVYQIGQILPVALGLKPISGEWVPQQWIKFSDAMSERKLIANLYTAKGINLPRYSSYYMFSEDRNLVFAVEIDPVLPVSFNTEQIFLRLYSNAYYQSAEGNAVEDNLVCNGKRMGSVQDIINLQAEVASWRTKPGSVTCYVNGFVVNDISPVTATVGNTAEYVYDSSVKRTVTFSVASLLTFTSILDSKYKYLLHHILGDNSEIDYQDDIDVNIIHVNTGNVVKGVYYHRNNPDSHRMVTHRDYSIVVDYLEYLSTVLIAQVGGNITSRDLKVQVTVRNSGYERPLIYDDNRVFELYKLPDEKILAAMVGLNATLPVWKAENLENSAYTALMRSKDSAINMSLVQSAYGYNSISKVIGDSPIKTVSNTGSQLASFPIGLQNNSTVYEYDSEGVLLGYHYHLKGSQYLASNPLTRMVEVVSGKGTKRTNTVFGTNNISVPVNSNYRVYMCFNNNGVPNNVWMDVTGTDQYTVTNGKIVWTNHQYDQFLMVRSDSTFLAYDVDLVSVDGTLSLVLMEEEDRGNGFLEYNLPVPMGEIDLYLNGKALINGLDYVVKFPKVHILNKTYLNQPAASEVQKVHVRFTGFCPSGLTMTDPDDFGFIQHGLLSNNNRFDIRDDKVLRITVDGSVRHRSDVSFSEESDAISIVNVSNGKPYQIKDVVVPLYGLVDDNTYTLRDKSLAIDKAVSDYLTVKLPQNNRGNLMAIANKYKIVSPFISRIINALQNKEILDEVVESNLNDNQVLEICSQFEYLLAFDPINTDNKFDLTYVGIIPHRNNTVITLSIYQYRLLVRIVKMYADGLIDLSSFVNFNS